MGFGMNGGDWSKMKGQGFGNPAYGPMGQGSKPSSPNSGASSLPAKNDAFTCSFSRRIIPTRLQNDELWTMPPGENPWRARATTVGKHFF